MTWKRLAVLLLAAIAVVSVTGTLLYRSRHAAVPLYSAAVVINAQGEKVLLPPGSSQVATIPGTRVLASAGAISHANEQRRWLEAGRVPNVDSRFSEMLKFALLDLHVLTDESGAALAGWSALPWRYVWPRDAAFVAAAFARTGHTRDAVRIILFLQRVQGADGKFQARYLPDGSGPPDNRGIQLDGTGWALWGARQVAAALPDSHRLDFLKWIQKLIDRSTSAILNTIANSRSLPPVSPDYWEVKESKPTLGTAAPLLAGLLAASELYEMRGQAEPAGRAAAGARRLERAIHEQFGRDGYPRPLGGSRRDTAVAFLLPPFTHSIDLQVVDAWRMAAREMRRPAGGLAPGAGWKQDGISWTAETAIFAMTAAAIGERTTAERWLEWLDKHRTTHGALPEKVLADGSPAAVAPLAWTAAAVILTAAQLERHQQ
jgi:glucoamylase